MLKTRPAVSIVLAVVLVATLLVGSAGCADQKEHQITGVWELTMMPVLDVWDPEAESSEWEILLYDIDGTVFGFAGFYHFQGARSGDAVNLSVICVAGSDEVETGKTMNLTVTGSNSMSGMLVSSEATEEGGGLSVSDLSAVRTGDAPSLEELAQGEEMLGGAADWVQKVLTAVLDKWFVPELFWNTGWANMDMMKPGSVHKDGAGYYMMGHHGPGERVGGGTYTFYYPLHWGHAGHRTYTFRLHSREPWTENIDLMLDKVEEVGSKYITDVMRFESVDKFRALVHDFHDRHGDFAITLIHTVRGSETYMYVNLANPGLAKGVKYHDLIQHIYLYGDAYESIMVGKDIKDTYRLRRPYGIVDGSPLFFTYVFGNIGVYYN